MSLEERPIRERLLEGAKQIGAYYRAGDRCQTMGWAVKAMEGAESCEAQVDPEELCKCGPKATRFCKAKVKWIILAMTEPRDIEVGDLGLALTMSGNEWDATGLTLLWSAPFGKFKVGGKKGMATFRDLKELMPDPLSGVTTLKLLVAFDGSKMEFEKREEKKEKVAE